nr:hypothetical protein [Tanacetum cinerariifolium]
MMDDALKLYQEMVSQPNVVTYNSLVSGLCKIRHWAKAYFLLKELLDKDISPDVETFNILISTICYEGRLQVAAHVIYMMHERDALSLYDLLGEDSKLNSNTSVIEVLLDGLFDCGELDFVRELFEGLSARGIKPTPGIYSSMICGFCEEGLINDAKRFLEKEENHSSPTTDTYNYLLLVYLENKCYDDVKSLYASWSALAASTSFICTPLMS